MVKSVVFIGCGDIASRAALLLQSQSIEVLCVRRNANKVPDTLPAVAADVQQTDTLEFLHNSTADTLVYSLAASAFNEESYTAAYVNGLRNTIAASNFKRIKRLVFISSTSVYHQNDGSVVDEYSATNPEKFNGKIMLEAEQLALNTGVATALRLSGIYGPGRTRLIDRVRNGLCSPEDTSNYTNRIQVEDCAGLLSHLIRQETIPEIIIGTDSNPATSYEVESYIAKELGIEKSYADATNKSPKRIAGNKRCSNKLMLNTGYTLQFPDFRSGYRQLIAES